jgi:hypothetical protein
LQIFDERLGLRGRRCFFEAMQVEHPDRPHELFLAE